VNTRLSSALLVSALALATVACGGDDTADTATTTTAAVPTTTTMAAAQPVDIVATALTAHVFNTLAGLVVDAGLVDTLRSPGPFTVFAPTDAAFTKLPLDTLHAVQDDPKLLATVLTYHVVPGALKVADLQTGQLMTVAGVPLDIQRNGDQVLVNGHPIVAADVQASNGVIHVMGDVLVPPG
jgi:uncharacterized surface protein with fasciclin (FAS1) repeats